jgi:hypothetical protein
MKMIIQRKEQVHMPQRRKERRVSQSAFLILILNARTLKTIRPADQKNFRDFKKMQLLSLDAAGNSAVKIQGVCSIPHSASRRYPSLSSGQALRDRLPGARPRARVREAGEAGVCWENLSRSRPTGGWDEGEAE